MIISTTHAIEGRQITAYLDIVSAESVQGVNVIRDMFAGMRDFFGGRSQTLERALKEARVQATDEIKERARACRRMRWSGWISRSACRRARVAWLWCSRRVRRSSCVDAVAVFKRAHSDDEWAFCFSAFDQPCGLRMTSPWAS